MRSVQKSAFYVGFTAALCVAVMPNVAKAQDCQLPNILVLLDVSGSMASNSKYTQAVAGINAFMNTYQNRAQFGLGVFPRPNEAPNNYGYCQIKTDDNGALINAVDFAAGNRTAFQTYLNSLGSPKATYDTPIYQALTAASKNAGLNDPSRRTYVLLISDGQQDCCRFNDYDAEPDCNPNGSFNADESQANRVDIRNLAALMKGSNIATYAIGFGAGVDPLTLNYVATAAQTKRTPTCNENGTSATATDNCYYRASDSSGLSSALAAIVQQINQETCDGTDEDCDGTIDNNLPTGPLCGIATGECSQGNEVCIDAEWVCRNDVGPSPETCDNLDNDCNGTIDDGIPSSGSCGTDVGLCSPGALQCVRGGWVCQGAVGPSTEVCDGLDNNCDNLPDNGIPCDCTQGQVRACGLTATGECTIGQQVCVASQGGFTWGLCDAVYPISEICDGLDNNCNTVTDEGTDQACSTACGPGVRPCINGAYGLCIPLNRPPEVCDGVDNDCDGEIDENTDIACTSACGPGIARCVAGSHGACVATNPPPEVCDGLDNDCDGEIDEGCPCQQGETRPCGKNLAQCTQGLEKCEFGQWSECIGANNGQGEICDGIDNDCNGLIDDGELCGEGSVCQCGGCRPACNPDNTCNNGGTCVNGLCQKDNCPQGEFCSEGKCTPGQPIGTLTEPPTVQDRPRAALDDSRGRIKGGCGCQDTESGEGAAFALLVVAFALSRRSKRA